MDSTTAAPSELSDDPTTALLIRARGFIERGWCRGASAKDAGGNSVEPTSNAAVAWCAFGALDAAVGEQISAGNPAYRRLVAAMGRPVSEFNDTQETAESVLAAFDRAIAGEPAARIAREG